MSTEPENPEIQQPIYRYDEPKPPELTAGGDGELIDAVSAHVEANVGPIEWVYHEIISEYVHVDLHYVPAAPDRPFQTLVTSGMAERPMNTHGQVEGERHAELMAILPPEWPVSDAAFKDPRNYWPVGWLKQLARFPHAYDTWLAFGHSMPNGDPPEPLAEGTELCAWVLLPSVLLPSSVHQMEMPSGKTVDFLCIVPLYREELALKLAKGTEALFPLFDRHGVTELIRPDRVNVAAPRRRWSLPFFRPRG